MCDSIGEAYDTLGALSWNFDWDWDAADREFKRAIALAPSYSCAHEDRAIFLASTDWSHHYNLGIGYEGTVGEYHKAIENSGGELLPTIALAHAYAAAGKKTEAERILRDLERKSRATASPYTMATIYAGLGENDKAFESLGKAYSEKSFEILWVNSDLLLDSLRTDPRFQQLLARLGLQ